ncbi:hypothetical protein V866_007479 [Kwoniella sp. B9012]
MSTFDFETAFPNPAVGREAVQDGPHVRPWVKTFAQPDFCLRNASGSDLPVFDIEGRLLCRGLIDAHVHVTAAPGAKTMADMVKLADQQVTLRATYVLREMLHRGFTTVRDSGGATKFLADAINEGLIEGPRFNQCGKAFHRRSRREELKQGADFIKIMLGGGVASESDALDTMQYTAEKVQGITTTAWQMDKKLMSIYCCISSAMVSFLRGSAADLSQVTALAHTVEAINHAINNGVRGIEHGKLLDGSADKLMAEKEVYLTPTLRCYGILVPKPFETFLNQEGRDKRVQVMQKGLNALKLAEDAGVTVCYGSDLLLISLHALHTGFLTRSKILPAAAILRHATVNLAKMLGQKGKLGVIAEGAIADLLVLSRNPLEDITVLHRPELCLDAVIK